MKTEEETAKFLEMITTYFVEFCTDEKRNFYLDDIEKLLDLFYLSFKDAIKIAAIEKEIPLRNMTVKDNSPNV